MEGSAHHLWGAVSDFTGVLPTLGMRLGLLGLVLAVASPEARAISASSAPAGFVRTPIAAGTGTRSATSLIGSPLLQAPVYAGRITRIASSAQVTCQAITIPQTAVDLSKPHGLFVTSGDFAGFTFRILSGTTRELTVETQGFDLSRVLAPEDTFEVRPLHTLRSLFGDDASRVPFAAGLDASRADQLMVRRESGWRAYWFTGSAWRRTGMAGDAGDDVLLPQDGIVVYRRHATATEVRLVGEVPTCDAVMSMPAGAISVMAHPFPAAMSLAELGLETTAGWRCAATAEDADQVQVCVNNSWRTYWYDGAGWRTDTGGLGVPTVEPGAALLIARKPNIAANPFALVTRPYDL